jgi:hypothetical protein
MQQQSNRSEQGNDVPIPGELVLSGLAERGLLWAWCRNAIQQPVFGYSEQQLDGCSRYWAHIPHLDRYVRVVLWPDGRFRTAHLDRAFRKRVLRRDPQIVGIDANLRDARKDTHK